MAVITYGSTSAGSPIDASKITSGRFVQARMPDGAAGALLTAQGLTSDPAFLPPFIAQPSRTAPARTKDTIYQNTSGKPLLVIATISCTLTAGVTATSQADLQIGAGTPPATIVASGGFSSIVVTENKIVLFVIVGLVPDGYYYRLASTVAGVGASLSLSKWEELTW